MAADRWVCAKSGHPATPSKHYTMIDERYALGRCRSCHASNATLVRADLYVDVKTKQKP